MVSLIKKHAAQVGSDNTSRHVPPHNFALWQAESIPLVAEVSHPPPLPARVRARHMAARRRAGAGPMLGRLACPLADRPPAPRHCVALPEAVPAARAARRLPGLAGVRDPAGKHSTQAFATVFVHDVKAALMKDVTTAVLSTVRSTHDPTTAGAGSSRERSILTPACLRLSAFQRFSLHTGRPTAAAAQVRGDAASSGARRCAAPLAQLAGAAGADADRMTCTDFEPWSFP